MKKIIDKNNEEFLKKTLASILAGVFLFTSTISWAQEERTSSARTEGIAFSSGLAKNNKLAPESGFRSEEFKTSLTVAAICKHIEHDGNLDDKSYLNDVLARLNAGKNSNITVLPYEIIIEIPNEELAVRYFDPTKANVITPYSDISKLETKVISPRLNRQIIHRIKALPTLGRGGDAAVVERQKLISQVIDLINNPIVSQKIAADIRDVGSIRACDELVIESRELRGPTGKEGQYIRRAKLVFRIGEGEAEVTSDQRTPNLEEKVTTIKVKSLDERIDLNKLIIQYKGEARKFSQLLVYPLPEIYISDRAFDITKGLYPTEVNTYVYRAEDGTIKTLTPPLHISITVDNEGRFRQFGVGPMLPNLPINDIYRGSVLDYHIHPDIEPISFSSVDIMKHIITTMLSNLRWGKNPGPIAVFNLNKEGSIAIPKEGIDWKPYVFLVMELNNLYEKERLTDEEKTRMGELAKQILEMFYLISIELTDKGWRIKDLPVEKPNDTPYVASIQNQTAQFDKYLEQNNLSRYTALRKLYTPEIINALLEDSALRPVFLLILPKHDLGPLNVIDSKSIDEIGEEEVLLNHSVFSVGTPEIANKLAKEGQHITIGVTDKHSKDTFKYPVSNGRQVYFPLPDGTWLGIKGSGQFADETEPPYFVHPFSGVHIGLASEVEAIRTMHGVKALKESGGRFVNSLGYRRIYALPDGQGGLVSVKDSLPETEGSLTPVLIYNRVLSPHRLEKFPQILSTDPNLKNMRKRISYVLSNRGDIPRDKVLSPHELIMMIAEEMGRTEALKQNHNIFKMGIHSQDMTFAGEEADNEEIVSYEKYINLLNTTPLLWDRESKGLLSDCKLSIAGIITKIIVLYQIIQYSKDKSIELPPLHHVLKSFFAGYFRSLDDDFFKHWAEELKDDVRHPIWSILNKMSNDVYEKISINEDMFVKMILEEINTEKQRRESKTEQKTPFHQIDYINKQKNLIKDMLGEDKPNTLVRVPVEAIESLDIDNIKDFLATFQEAANAYVELYYMSGIAEVSENVYQKYGLQKKSLPKDLKRTRENTVTLFPALKGEEINQSAIVSRLGSLDISPQDTILSPIGLQHDPAGLIRATIIGLKMMDIARQIKEKGIGITKDQAFKDKIQLEILEQLKNICDIDDLKNFNLTPDDIIALATGTINNIITALKKLIKLLPITPINAEELRQIYEHAKEVITAA